MKTFYIILIITVVLVGCSAIESISFVGASAKIKFKLVKAHIYKNKETGSLLYCSNKHKGKPRDYVYLGTSDIDKSKINKCSLAN